MKKLVCGLVLAIPLAVQAETMVDMKMVDDKGSGESVGTVTISESPYGLVFSPMLHGMTPGMHGFHLHQNGSCEPGEKDGKMVPGLGAGGHYDPEATGMHGMPWGKGHMGDLPPLYVDADGKAETAVMAPRPKMADLKGRALIIHAGGDNHADHPMPLGGGGGRVACGLIP